jgi:hypothetical protein
VLFGSFDAVANDDKPPYLQALTDTFIPGRAAEVRRSTPRERAATLVLRMGIGADNWSLKVGDGWSEDPEEDVASAVWAGVVPITMSYGEPRRAPDCDEAIPVPPSVLSMTGTVANRRPQALT